MQQRCHNTIAVGSMIAAFLAAPAAEAVTIRHDVDDSLYIALGYSYPSVGMLAGASGGFGSGVLLSSNWVLTAAHVVDSPGWTGTFYPNGPTGYSATNVYIHPGYDPSYLAYDYALVFIPSGVQGVAPSPYFAGAISIGSSVTSIGWGYHGTGLTGPNAYDGYKRGFENTLDQLMGQFAVTDFDSPSGSNNSIGSPTALAMEGSTAPGDSGGGLFVDFGAGPWLIAITTSGSAFDEAMYGSLSYYSLVSGVSSWIQSTTGIVPVPEPGTSLVLAVAMLAAMARRGSRS